MEMDNNDSLEALGQEQNSGVVIGGEAGGADWRTELQQGSRERNVNKIMETLKTKLRFSGQEGMQDVMKMALRFEEKLFIAATSQSDYMTKIWWELLMLETEFQYRMENSRQFDAANQQQQANTLTRDTQQRIQSTGPMLQQQITFDQQKQLLQSSKITPEVPLTSLDSSSQIGSATSRDWQDEIYQKIISMQEMYYPELNERYQQMAAKLRQHDNNKEFDPRNPNKEEFQILMLCKLTLERLIIILWTNKRHIKLDHKAKIVGVENQIVNILNIYSRHRKSVSSLQQGQLTQPHMPSNKGQMNSQMQTMNIHGPIMPPQPMKGQMETQMLPMNNTLYSGSRVSNPRQYVLGALQRGSNVVHGQYNAQMQQFGLQQQTDTISKRPATNYSINWSHASTANHIRQQKQLLQSLKVMPELPLNSSSQMGSATSGDWREEVHQKIKSMHEKYYLELKEMYLLMVAELQQHDARPQQPMSDSFEKFNFLKLALEGVIMFLQTDKDDIQLFHKMILVCEQYSEIALELVKHNEANIQLWKS